MSTHQLCVKAQYRGEYRKFSVPSFPSFEELTQKLHRVFPHLQGKNHYLSNVYLFPDAGNNAHILIGHAVRDEAAYAQAVAPHQRLYRNAVLKLVIIDGAPLAKQSSFSAAKNNYETAAPDSAAKQRGSLAFMPGSFHLGQPTGPSSSFWPPPPPPLPFLPAHPSTPMDVDPHPQNLFGDSGRPLPTLPAQSQTESSPAPNKDPPKRPARAHSHSSMASSCCSESVGEVQSLMSTFKSDLENIMSSFDLPTPSKARTFNEPPTSKLHLGPLGFQPSSTSLDDEYGDLMEQLTGDFKPMCLKKWCSSCQRMFSGAWYSCVSCGFVVLCPDCHKGEERPHSELFGESHVLTRQTCAGCPEVVEADKASHKTNITPLRPFACGRGSDEPAYVPPPPTFGMYRPPPPPPSMPNCYPASKYSAPNPYGHPFNPYSFAPVQPPFAYRPSNIPPPPIGRPMAPSFYIPPMPPMSNRAPPAPSAPATPPPFTSVTPPPMVVMSSPGEPLANDVVHPGILCDECDKGIVGVRHKCLECWDFDLCTPCIEGAGIIKHDPFHRFSEIATPRLAGTNACTRFASAAAPTVASFFRSPPGPPPAVDDLVIHHGVVCDSCNETLIGVRHKCMDCEDYDLCTLCMDNEAAVRHDPFHAFVDIPTPGRVVIHEVCGGQLRPSQAAVPVTASTPAVATPAPAPTIVESPITDAAPAVHGADCDLCDSRIHGDRYKCASCPDWDVCANCFTICPVQHPGHNFVKITKVENFVMAKVTNESVVRHQANCNGCGKPILGVRFKCMHSSCPDYDLCAACEAHPISQHSDLHPMLKIKRVETVIPRVNRASPIYVPAVPPSPTLSAVPPPALIDTESSNTEEETTERGSSSLSKFILPMLNYPEDTRELWPKLTQELKHLIGSVTPLSEEPVPSDAIPGSPLGGEELLTRVPTELSDSMPVQAAPSGIPLSLAALLHPVPSSSKVTPVVAATAVIPQEDTDDLTRGRSSYPELERLRTQTALDVQRLQENIRRWSEQDKVEEMEATAPEPSSPIMAEVFSTPGPMLAVEVLPVATLNAVFLSDTTIPDGQVLPPGSEFVKSWQMSNVGTKDWPATTELVFVAGDALTKTGAAVEKAKVGTVFAGASHEVSTGELKAPESPGRYVGYWRLNDGTNFFGSSIWIDITVPEVTQRSESDDSMSSSSIIMPQSAAAQSVASSVPLSATIPVAARSKATSDDSSDGSSVSLISVPSSEDDDWEDSRSEVVITPAQPGNALEYVLLYDDASCEED